MLKSLKLLPRYLLPTIKVGAFSEKLKNISVDITLPCQNRSAAT